METKLIKDYKLFDGYNEHEYGKSTYVHQMYLLIKEGFKPLTTKDIMEYRIKAIESKNKNEIDFWLNHSFDTADGLAYDTRKGELIIVPNSELLLNINKDYSIDFLALTEEKYKELSKKYRVYDRFALIFQEDLTRMQAKIHPIWFELAQNNSSLLENYIDAIFNLYEEEANCLFKEEVESKSKYNLYFGSENEKSEFKYNYDKNMGIYLPRKLHEGVYLPNDKPVMRAWYLNHLDGRSSAGGMKDITYDYDACLLIGIHK